MYGDIPPNRTHHKRMALESTHIVRIDSYSKHTMEVHIHKSDIKNSFLKMLHFHLLLIIVILQQVNKLFWMLVLLLILI